MTKDLPNSGIASRNHRMRTIMPWLAVAVVLSLPVQFGLVYLNGGAFVWRGLVAGAGTLGLFVASSWLAMRMRTTWTVVAGLFLLATFFLHMLFFGVTRFSGRGFDDGFFLSLTSEAISVAWHQYFYLFALAGLGSIALLVALAWITRHLRTPPGRTAMLLASVSVCAIAIGYRTTPAWQLANGMRAWYAPIELKLPESRLAAWRKSPLVDIDLVSKQTLTAQPATPPKNLILLYVESGGVALAPADRYPGLMPNMKRLIAEDSLVPHIHASSYITIEGLVNTQCGTLLPFDHGENSATVFGNQVNALPCLGDVLAKAGYRQTYLAGTSLQFAGTGQFLGSHGYDKIVGFEEWSRMGFKARPDTWGLSDVDLFEQSFAELKRLKASGHPFNLTLFTIGSHVPGFVYSECGPYRGDGTQRFLNAVHCSDQLIGQWVDRLRKEGWLDDNTILVITGDHQVFPSPEMNQLFGNAAVADHRLPLIVIGKHAKPALDDGAGYDLAPTVLDLLGVQSNARFALGRSLMRNDRHLAYFPARYDDMLDEENHAPADRQGCDAAEAARDAGRIPGMQPLDACERKELDMALKALATAYSSPPPQMRCNAATPLRALVPANVQKDIQLEVSGQRLARDFRSAGQYIWPRRPGLYLLRLDADGSVTDQSYAAPGDIGQMTAASPAEERGAMVILWRPGDHASRLPDWLARLGVTHEGGVWVYALDGKSGAQLREHASPGQTLAMSGQACRALLP